MSRYTKKDNNNRYYIESVNGKLESNIFGHTYGESIDRFAELEEKIEHGELAEVVHASWKWGKVCGQNGIYCTNCQAGWVDSENVEFIAHSHDYCPKCGAKMDAKRK